MPFSIISINKNSENLKKYVFHSNELSKVLEPIKDRQICIIPILGPSRNENSFLINFLMRFLSAVVTTDWIGEKNEIFGGFACEAGLESETPGLWVSEPFFVKQTNGNEMAVLLMDTQGVFDVNSNQRDYSGLVSISLLMSSRIILNLLHDPQEGFLMSLESFLQFKAMFSTTGQKLRQDLLILIRDWNNPEKFEYGFIGGKNYLESQTSQIEDVRKLFKEEFEEVSCFLMPKLENHSEEKSSDVSVDKNQDRYVFKLKEFCEFLLNPESLKPKTFGKSTIKSKDLTEYFNSFVDILNRNDIIDPNDLVKAITETEDSIQGLNLAQSITFLDNEPLTLEKVLKAQMDDLLLDGENRLDKGKLISQMLEKCCNYFKEIIEDLLNSKFIDYYILDDNLEKNKIMFEETFQKIMADENTEDISKELSKLKEKLENLAKHFRDRNRRQREKDDRINKEAVVYAVGIYKKSMEEILENNYSAAEFKDFERDVGIRAKKEFEKKYIPGDSNMNVKYKSEFDEIIKELKTEFKKKRSNEKDRIEALLKTEVKKSKEFYSNKMQDFFSGDSFYSDEKLMEFHKSSKDKAINVLEDYSISEKFQLNEGPYAHDLNKLIEKEYQSFVDINSMRKDLNALVDQYEKQMDSYIDIVKDENTLIEKHKQEKSEKVSNFTEKYQIQESETIDLYRNKLDDRIENCFSEIKKLAKLNIKKRELVIIPLKNNFRVSYREEMNKYYQKTSFYSKENFRKIHESVLKRTIAKYESERGKIPYDSYLRLSDDFVEDIYKEIKSENDMNTPTNIAIGIDLGTTNSCVAYYRPGLKNKSSVVVINEIGSTTNSTPSLVVFKDEGIIVGLIEKPKIEDKIKNRIYSVKRLIGRHFNEPSVQTDISNLNYEVVDDGKNMPKIKVNVKGVDEYYSPEEISSKVLIKMKEIAEKHFESEQSNITKAVITVPAYFKDKQKRDTKKAGELAGFGVIDIINEPTAASLAYKLNRSSDNSRKVLIYDFGGGTFDVAILNIEKAEINVMATVGNTHLGGDDIDNILVNYCLNEFCDKTGISVPKEKTTHNFCRLRIQCEQSKCLLSRENVYSTTIELDNFSNNRDLKVHMTRQKFEELTKHLFKESIELVTKALKDSGLTTHLIDDIVLVGGTTRIPLVQKMLSEMFDGRPLNNQINPDEAVAVGAAIQAAIINGQQAQDLGYLKLRDVAPMSLGVKVKGGFMSIIIERNSKIPYTYNKLYTTTSDFQTEVNIVVYEGENEMVDQNTRLGEFKVTAIPAAPKGEQNIIVTFEITDEGILNVRAKIPSNGFETEVIRIEDHKGKLNSEELEQLILRKNI